MSTIGFTPSPPHFFKYEGYNRTLMVKFTCRRCNKEHVCELKDRVPEDCNGRIDDIRAPKGWANHYGGLLCDECYPKYLRFISGEEIEADATD